MIFFKYVAWISAHDQYCGPRLALWSKLCIISPSVLLGHSATSFWKEASGVVSSNIKPASAISHWNWFDPHNLPPSSVLMYFCTWCLVAWIWKRDVVVAMGGILFLDRNSSVNDNEITVESIKASDNISIIIFTHVFCALDKSHVHV